MEKVKLTIEMEISDTGEIEYRILYDFGRSCSIVKTVEGLEKELEE